MPESPSLQYWLRDCFGGTQILFLGSEVRGVTLETYIRPSSNANLILIGLSDAEEPGSWGRFRFQGEKLLEDA